MMMAKTLLLAAVALPAVAALRATAPGAAPFAALGRVGHAAAPQQPRAAISLAIQPSRREAAALAAALGASAAFAGAGPAKAASPKTVLVAGATGKTGRLVCSTLSSAGGVNVIGGVRDPTSGKAKALDAKSLRHLDITESVDQIAAALDGVDSIVCAVGFAGGNPFEMGKLARAVDNVGTCKLIEAASAAKISKFVMVSSILTNGRAWGQEKSPGFVITNAFGGVLDEKLVAERALKSSGLDFTIVRPAGLRDSPTEPLLVSAEDTLNSGEVSRASVASVCAEALFSSKSSGKVVEIFESPSAEPTPKSKWFA